MLKIAKTFVIDRYLVTKSEEGIFNISFFYKTIFEDKSEIVSKEIIELPSTDLFPQAYVENEDVLNRVLETIHIALGVSYWKMYCPKEISLLSQTLTKQQAKFWTKVYTNGLGEFFYRNNITIDNRIRFPHVDKSVKPFHLHISQNVLTGVGGGKDSVVALEMVKELGFEQTPVYIHYDQLSKRTVEEINYQAGLKGIFVKRHIDEHVKSPSTYKGHVPVSAIIASINLLLSLLYDARYIIVANEHSSNYGNVLYDGYKINHQWSKSFEFEQLFQSYVKFFISPDIHYFSILRNKNELQIARMFAQYPTYFPYFVSCNKRASKELWSASSHRSREMLTWCGACAKCLFVYIMLRPFIDISKMDAIFDKNLLNDESLLLLLQELLGEEEVKPFDCVGTPEEVSAAMYLISKQIESNEANLVTYFKKNVMSKGTVQSKQVVDLLNATYPHEIPDEFLLS